eukprot:s119_g86.t1
MQETRLCMQQIQAQVVQLAQTMGGASPSAVLPSPSRTESLRPPPHGASTGLPGIGDSPVRGAIRSSSKSRASPYGHRQEVPLVEVVNRSQVGLISDDDEDDEEEASMDRDGRGDP